METLLYLLPALACPIGMGLMMWLMMRGQHGQPATRADGRPAQPSMPPPVGDPEVRLARLRAELADVEARQAAIADEIGRLSGEDEPAAAEARR
jgi:hypothetical protein